ncbi:MAG: hypothetical protein JWO25_523 [Alphaproteobacteria bacterium]|nr:hypothetical protein [Alphaproteobacteria bacterium]
MTQHGLLVNLALLGMLSLFMFICVSGALAGLDSIRKAQPLDFMAPAWFVASAMGVVCIALISVAFVVEIARDLLSGSGRGGRRRR